MNFNEYNISQDWGWYFDTESNSYINSNKIEFIVNKPYKKLNYLNNKLDKFEQEKEQHDYYKNPLMDRDNKEVKSYSIYEKSEIKNEKYEKKSDEIFVYKICSTTIITTLLTYIIFFMI